MTWFLIINDTQGQRGLVLDGTTTYSLGRTSSADICLANECVSGQHGRLEPLADNLGFLLIDTHSRNGSFNAQGQRIKTVRLREGEPIYLGSKHASITLVQAESLSHSHKAALLSQAVPVIRPQVTRLPDQGALPFAA